jgi:hypothetical protein
MEFFLCISSKHFCFIAVCIGWKQTKNCDPNGEVEEGHNKDCEATIAQGWSGYCLCKGGWKAMQKGCAISKYSTCNEACSGN